MTTQLTEQGKKWAEEHASESIVANVALYGEGWPVPFVDASRLVANEQGEEASK